MRFINLFFLGLKREFWEHRRSILWIPIIFSVALFFASAAVTFGHRTSAQGALQTSSQQEELQPKEGEGVAEAPVDIKQLQTLTSGRYASVFIGMAWLVSIFYLLSSFYTDRKDSSVLFWKSLPVSETQNAISKLFFAALCFPAVALVIAWLSYSVLTVLGLGAMHSTNDGDTWIFVERTFESYRLIVMPIAGVFIGLLWSLPVFCYALMISAVSRRSPFMMFFLPLIGIGVIEWLVNRSGHIVGLLSRHLPFSVLDDLSHSNNLSEFFYLWFADRSGELIGGWVLAAIFLCVAIWFRNRRFEI